MMTQLGILGPRTLLTFVDAGGVVLSWLKWILGGGDTMAMVDPGA